MEGVMNADLQARIEAAVAQNWDSFSRLHPALSRAIDQATLGREVAKALAEDPEFDRAYRAAIEANVGAKVMASFVEQFVAPVMQRLF